MRAYYIHENDQNVKNTSKMHLGGEDGVLGTPSYRAKTPRPAEHP